MQLKSTLNLILSKQKKLLLRILHRVDENLFTNFQSLICAGYFLNMTRTE